MRNVEETLAALGELPMAWHGHGSLITPVLEAMAERLIQSPPRASVETGTGKSTLLISSASARHIVFTLDDPVQGSLRLVRESPLLERSVVEFVLGPTQSTMRNHALPPEIDFALIDGPHAYPFPELEYYAIYPHLSTGATLVLDDVHVPTIGRLLEFLAADDMFDCEDVIRTTAFLRRTSAPTFDPLGDSWNHQAFNRRSFPDFRMTRGFSLYEKTKARVPEPIRKAIKKHVLRRDS